MSFCEVYFRSPAIGKQTSMNVILPEPELGAGPFPVYYLLHGLSDDHSIWHRRTRIEWYVRNLPLIVVMPDGGRGWYSDAVAGFAYETSLIEDVIGFVDRTFQTVAAREGRAVGGLSMGGYGAMKLGLKHRDKFCSVNSHSGALNIVRSSPRDEIQPELQRVFGADAVGGVDDLFAIAEQMSPADAPAIRFDCGVDDFLIQHNRDFHALLTARGITHEYAEFPGAHTWEFWDEHVQEALAFHCRALGIEG